MNQKILDTVVTEVPFDGTAVSIEIKQTPTRAELIEERVRRFCVNITVSPVLSGGKIDWRKATYHSVKAIRTAVTEILGSSLPMSFTGNTLRNLGREKCVLEWNKTESMTVFALTEEGVRQLFEMMERKATKPRTPRSNDICLPAPIGNGARRERWVTGSSIHS